LTTQVLTGLLLLVLPVAYNGLYTLLARSFDYPNILRHPTGQVLERFTAGGSRLVLTWWGFAMSAVLLAPTVVLLSATLADADPTVGHSILVIAWHLLADDCDYQDLGGDYFVRRDTDRQRQRAAAQLQALGYRVTLEPLAA
jgi:hypothetical protein